MFLLLELDLTESPAVPNSDDPLARLRARGRHQLGPILRATLCSNLVKLAPHATLYHFGVLSSTMHRAEK